MSDRLHWTRRRAIGAFVVLLTACSLEAGTPVPTSHAAEPQSNLRRSIAIFPFENNSVTAREKWGFLSEWIADAIGTRLGDAAGLKVVERRALLEILQEQKLGSSNLAAKETQIRLGKLAGAQMMLFGGFTAIGDTMLIDSRVVDVESGVILRSETVRGHARETRVLAGKLVDTLAENLGLDLARRSKDAGLLDNSELAASELFYEGLAMEQSGDFDSAIEKYTAALQLRPTDAEARARLKKLLVGGG